MIDHQIWVFTCFNRNFQTNSCGKCWSNLVSPSSKQVSVAGGRCSRGFPRGAGAFLPWQWISWRSKFPSLTSEKVNPNMLISVIFLQILSKFINISSIYHGYSVILDVGNIHEIHHLMCFRMTCHGWPPGNIPRNDGSFVSALVCQSHGYHWPIDGGRTKKQQVWQIN